MFIIYLFIFIFTAAIGKTQSMIKIQQHDSNFKNSSHFSPVCHIMMVISDFYMTNTTEKKVVMLAQIALL